LRTAGVPALIIEVSADGWLTWPGRRVRAALGKNGVIEDKREGDGKTPIGMFPLRRLLYRDDRGPPPATGLERTAIQPDWGWSDDPDDPAYNRLVILPHAARHERLWRRDGLYDLVVPIGYNDAPTIAGRGSAIFIHVARPDYGPTEGCVALALDDLVELLRLCGPETLLSIKATAP